MKGVILCINPAISIIDITHHVSHHNLVHAAFLLYSACRYFPPGSIHVAVVDPGVGTERKPIVMQTARYFLVGPDNGIFSLLIKEDPPQRVLHLTNRDFFHSPVSRTFHGRDIFAPVAAHLSLGVALEEMGRPVSEWQSLSIPEIERQNDSVKGEVISIDTFGNLITNIPGAIFKKKFSRESCNIWIGKNRVEHLCSNYEEGTGKGPFAIIGSSGGVGISFYQESAEKALSVSVGQSVIVNLEGNQHG